MASTRHTNPQALRRSTVTAPMTGSTIRIPHHRFQAVTSVAVARSHRQATNGGAVRNGVGGRKSLGSVPSIHQHDAPLMRVVAKLATTGRPIIAPALATARLMDAGDG